MIDVGIWESAKQKGWLIPRDKKSYLVNNDVLPLTPDSITPESLTVNHFDAKEQLIILFKVSDEHKDDFKKLVLASNKSDRGIILKNIGYLLKEVFLRLKLEVAN